MPPQPAFSNPFPHNHAPTRLLQLPDVSVYSHRKQSCRVMYRLWTSVSRSPACVQKGVAAGHNPIPAAKEGCAVCSFSQTCCFSRTATFEQQQQQNHLSWWALAEFLFPYQIPRYLSTWQSWAQEWCCWRQFWWQFFRGWKSSAWPFLLLMNIFMIFEPDVARTSHVSDAETYYTSAICSVTFVHAMHAVLLTSYL